MFGTAHRTMSRAELVAVRVALVGAVRPIVKHIGRGAQVLQGVQVRVGRT